MATISYTMDLGVWVCHLAAFLLKGVTAELIPFPLPLHCILPMFVCDKK
jgi:hypothetical protein